eukprot:jgi/Botrbrau1/7029/Bobra.0165s0054.2
MLRSRTFMLGLTFCIMHALSIAGALGLALSGVVREPRRLLLAGPNPASTPGACVPASLDTGFPYCGDLGPFSVTMCCSAAENCHVPAKEDFEYGDRCLAKLDWYCCNFGTGLPPPTGDAG